MHVGQEDMASLVERGPGTPLDNISIALTVSTVLELLLYEPT